MLGLFLLLSFCKNLSTISPMPTSTWPVQFGLPRQVRLDGVPSWLPNGFARLSSALKIMFAAHVQTRELPRKGDFSFSFDVVTFPSLGLKNMPVMITRLLMFTLFVNQGKIFSMFDCY